MVLEEGSSTEVSAKQGGAMSEQEGMHAEEHSRPEIQEEKDNAVASNAEDFVDQTDPEEFSQNAESAYHSPPKNPRSNEHESESVKEQSMK